MPLDLSAYDIDIGDTRDLVEKLNSAHRAIEAGVNATEDTVGDRLDDQDVIIDGLAGAMTAGVTFKGTHSAAGGSYPAGPANGDYWIISAAGTISGVYFNVGDSIVYYSSSWIRVVAVLNLSTYTSGRPTIRPSLLLDFANSKVLDPRITFTRASLSGGYYDGKTFAKAEENLLLQSQGFSETSVWSVSGATISADTTVAPDGTTTADTITASAGASTHLVQHASVSVNGSTVYVISFYAKAGTHNYVQVYGGSGAWGTSSFVTFDLTPSAGAVGSSGGTATGSIVALANDWYRCVCVLTASSTAASNIIINIAQNGSGGRANSWTAAGTETVHLWGAQLEQRSSVTVYTATTTQPITRYQPQMLTAAANEPVFDHNPVTGESLGLRIEESRANIWTYSEFQSIAGLSRTALSDDFMFGPDGNYVAAQRFGNNSTLRLLYGKTVSATTQYTLSVFVKMDDGLAPVFGSTTGSSALNDFALVMSGTAVSTALTVTHVGNGLYRVSGTLTTGASNLGNNGIVKYTTNSARGFRVTGMQLETGAFATSYIKTEASQVTRAAASAVMTGTNFSSWYRQDEGTFYAEGRRNGTANTFPNLAVASDGTANNRILVSIYGGSNQPALDVVSGGATQCAITKTGVGTSVSEKVDGAYKTNDFALTADGAAVSVDTQGVLPLVNQLRIGANATGTVSINGTIKKIAYYPARLPDAVLQAMTA